MKTEEPPDTKRVSKEIGSRIRLEREKRGWSQEELADKIGTTQVNISRWEKGSTTPGPYYRQSLAKQFGKTLEELGFVKSEEKKQTIEIPTTSSTEQQTGTRHWNVPYRRNPFFTGREVLLHQLYTILNTNKMAALTQTQAISGLGGIGKTQVAVEYAYRYRDNYQAVLWVNASTYDSLVADFFMLAALLDLTEKDQDQLIVVNVVKRWFALNKNWLLIFDNVDDPQLVEGFLPRLGEGSILITTRQHALGSIAQTIEVEKMEREEGVLFLMRRIRILNSDNTATRELTKEELALAHEIVEATDGLPLAIDQAGAYIEETRCGLKGYLDLYQSRHKELLQRRGILPTDHPESVAATLSLSFEQIMRQNPIAADLLRLLAFFDPEAIPEEMIILGVSALDATSLSEISDPFQFNEAIQLLMRYSLIRRIPDEQVLSTHRLVQVVLKDSLPENEQRIWAEYVIRVLNQVFPEVDPETWSKCQRYIPHVQAGMASIKQLEVVISEAADLFTRASHYLIEHAQYALAEELLQSALSIQEQLQLSDKPETAITVSELGLLYLAQGKYLQARPLLEQGRDIRQRTLGLQEPGTAASLDHLGQLYYALGKYSEAEKLYRQALDIRQKVFTTENREVAASLAHLAELNSTMGYYKPAEELYKQALSIQQKILGDEHPDVAHTLNDLALVYRRMGWYSDAEQLYWSSHNIFLNAYGKEHPHIAEVLNNLARLYRAQAQFDKAELYYRQALEIRENVLGVDHPDTARNLVGLAKLYHSQGKYSEAIDLSEQALSIQEQKLAANHPDTADTLRNIARLYQALRKYPEAEAYYNRAMAICENTPGSKHPRVALILSGLSELYMAQGNYQEAKPLIERSLEIRKETLGPDHPYVAYNLENLAKIHHALREYSQAEALYKEALAIRINALGSQHPYTANTSSNLAQLYIDMQRYEEAEPLLLNALNIREEAPGSEHRDLAASLEQYAHLLRKTRREHEARAFEQRAMTTRARHKK
ncbi:MAG TPA: tetratricopeptide repeat protein [Ktedonobacteraceae bacterium]|jgi:tetratricopeptide (TPR) repeat protein/transcriptional regulator with XRE-family HTH domain|nr:tetratricopeptide repeat protein [Ktedonobacteraceae bacterium]